LHEREAEPGDERDEDAWAPGLPRWGYSEQRPDDDDDPDRGWALELLDALRGPRTSLLDDRSSSTEGCVSIEDMHASIESARHPGLVLDTLQAPPKLQRARIERHPWLRANLAIGVILGVTAPRRTRPVSCESRRARPRSRARHSPRAPRGPPDDASDPEPPPRGRARAQRAGSAL
jgi:hypothetical protein